MEVLERQRATSGYILRQHSSFGYTARLASTTLAGWKVSSFFHHGTSVSYVPQVLQGVHNADTHLFAHLGVADVDVESGDDGSLAEVLRDNAVDDAPEPPDVVTQRLLSFLL